MMTSMTYRGRIPGNMNHTDMMRIISLREKQDEVFTAIQMYENVEITGVSGTGKSYFMGKIGNHYSDCALFCVYSDDMKALISTIPIQYDFLDDNYNNRPIIPLHPELSLSTNLDLLHQYSRKPQFRLRDGGNEERQDDFPPEYTFNDLLKKTSLIIISNHVSKHVFQNDYRCPDILNSKRMDRLDEILRQLRQTHAEMPFGNVQIVLFNHDNRETSIRSSLLRHMSLTPKKHQ